jgi:signal peptidase I
MSENAPTSSPKPSWTKRIFHGLAREILVPISMALVVIFFVIQAFKIPSGSMEDTLLVGDFLLGLKFIYGSPIPFSEKRLPGFQDPEPGDIIIFRFPGEPEYPDYEPARYSHIANLLMLGNLYWDRTPGPGQQRLVHFPEGPKDFIKRCVAKSGQTVQIKDGVLHVDGVPHVVPGYGKYLAPSREPTPRDFFGPVRVPGPGDTLRFAGLKSKDLWFVRSLMMQENPQVRTTLELKLVGPNGPIPQYVFENFRAPLFNHKGFLANVLIEQMPEEKRMTLHLGDTIGGRLPFAFFSDLARTGFIPHPDPNPTGFKRTIGYDSFDPSQLEDLENNVAILNSQLDSTQTAQKLRVEYSVLMDGKPVEQYVVQQKAFFMMGDNRDNSQDSRFWGFVSHRNIKAKAFIVYFSFDNADDSFAFTNPISWFKIPFKVRWLRFGKLINDIGRPWE